MRIKAEFSIFYPNFWGQNKCLLTVFVKKHFGSSLALVTVRHGRVTNFPSGVRTATRAAPCKWMIRHTKDRRSLRALLKRPNASQRSQPLNRIISAAQ